MDHTVSGLGLLSYRYHDTGIGFGLYYQKTVVPEGLLRDAGSVHDELGIEGNLEIRYHHWEPASSYTEFAFAVGAVWNVWFTSRFAAYPKLGFGLGFGSLSTPAGVDDASTYGGLFGLGAVGAVYKTGGLVLRAEISNVSIGFGLGLSVL